MSLLDLISRWSGLSGPGLLKILEYIRDNVPDLAEQATGWIAALEQAGTPANLAAVGSAVMTELGQIGQGKINPKHHPAGGI